MFRKCIRTGLLINRMSEKSLIDYHRLSPDQVYGQLFRDVQLQRIFSDTKTFVDCIPKIAPQEIREIYEKKKGSDLNLSEFIHEYFTIPSLVGSTFISDLSMSTGNHINQLWNYLCRPADEPTNESSRINLPYPYVVPGGRFREIFYWDSYFTMLGLSLLPDRIPMIENMINNFSYLITQYGFIPNGTRAYFLSRSHPPFFACMIDLFAQISPNPSAIRRKYFPFLLREYQFWMEGKDQLNERNLFHQHVVRIDDRIILNRYFDPLSVARPEAYPKEEEQCQRAQTTFGISPEEFYQHNRAACESGWDFSSRWFDDGQSKESNRCANIVPVDLNCLMYFIEHSLSLMDDEQAEKFRRLAQSRKETIRKLFWSEEEQFYMDYDPIQRTHRKAVTLAGVYPLFFQIATPEQAEHVQQRLRRDFLQLGGLVTTLERTGQQWDAPMGFAPLQWIAYQAMKNYGFDQLAEEIRTRWLNLNDRVFQQTGKMTEKYNVIDQTEGGGGNYPLQDGFGWTNGVYLRLLQG